MDADSYRERGSDLLETEPHNKLVLGKKRRQMRDSRSGISRSDAQADVDMGDHRTGVSSALEEPGWRRQLRRKEERKLEHDVMWVFVFLKKN